jgi:transcriptional regulator with XRE-family HTH domain
MTDKPATPESLEFQTNPNGGDDFRATLIAARKALGLHQSQVAAKMGMARTSVSNYEQGTYVGTLAFVQAYADAVGYELTLTPKRGSTAGMAQATSVLLEATGYADSLASEEHYRVMSGSAGGSVSTAELNQLRHDAHVAIGAAVYRCAEALVRGGGGDVHGVHKMAEALLNSREAGQEKARRQVASDEMGTGNA